MYFTRPEWTVICGWEQWSDWDSYFMTEILWKVNIHYWDIKVPFEDFDCVAVMSKWLWRWMIFLCNCSMKFRINSKFALVETAFKHFTTFQTLVVVSMFSKCCILTLVILSSLCKSCCLKYFHLVSISLQMKYIWSTFPTNVSFFFLMTVWIQVYWKNDS